MYYPYLAVFWNPTDPLQYSMARHLLRKVESSKVGWTLGMSVTGGAVFTTHRPVPPMRIYTLPHRRGILFGVLFHRTTAVTVSPESLSQDSGFDSLDPEGIAGHIVNNYWGAYVGFAADSHTSAWMAIRDCSGMIPCYVSTISGVCVFVADIRHLAEIHDAFTIDWRYLTAYLCWPHLQVRDTALIGVQELLAGEMVVASANRRKTGFAWNPISVCLSNPLLDPKSASCALLNATQCSVSAWASVHHRLLHSLSGGFDSATVLGAILRADPRPEVLCVNRYGDAPGEDERRFARSVARPHGLRLLEFPWARSGHAFDERCLAAPLTAKPSAPYFVGLFEAPFWNELSRQYGCDGITTGQGGDQVFMSARTTLGIADCLRFHGLGKQFRDALRDTAALTGQSFLHMLISAAAASLNRKRFGRYAHYMPTRVFLSGDAIFPELAHYILPPWCIASGALPPGKRFQVLLLADVVTRHRPFPDVRDTEELHPLLSQPLLETALRIPVHILLTGGKTRGLARCAFKDYLPREIITRETKGHTCAYTLDLVRRSLPFVREILLQGHLVKRGLLSRDILAQSLGPAEHLRPEAIFPLLACISAELWIRCWLQHSRDRECGAYTTLPMPPSPIDHNGRVQASSAPNPLAL